MRRAVAYLSRDVYTEPIRPFQRDFGTSFAGARAAACASWVYSGAGSARTITVGSMRCTDLFCKAVSSTARVVSSRACVLWERALDEACATQPAPPVFGMIQRGGQVVINMIANVKQKTIEPLIKETIVPGTLVYTDEYSIYARLCAWGYDHKRVNHGRGEYARDEDGDGFCEVHVHTMEGFVRSVG
jgi:hypothetical protein